MRLFTFLLSLLSLITLAQDGINYQGVATNGYGAELINQNISVKASVISDSSNGTIQWQEIHSTTTDQFGLFNVVIGQGSSTAVGQTINFDNMNWGSSNHFLKIEMDISGGNNYSLIGTTQMMSVPYALYAKNSAIDSIAILSLINSSNGSVGCDYKYPIGLNGEPIVSEYGYNSPYTVPAGKNLIVLGTNATGTVNNLPFETINQGENMILKSGDVLSSSNTTRVFHGILIPSSQQVLPIISEYGYYSNYTVPAGKNLIILGTNATGTVNNLPFETINQGEIMVLKSGDVLSSSNTTRVFHGYLVDENYFSNCFVGSTNSASLIDSSYIDSLVQFYSGGNSGCNFTFPDGLSGDFISIDILQGDYTVPSGKNLYILNAMTDVGNQIINLNGKRFIKYDNDEWKANVETIMAGSGSTLSNQYQSQSSGIQSSTMFGYLTDKKVDFISIDILQGDYTVPLGKNLYILNAMTDVGIQIINLNGKRFIRYDNDNWGDSEGFVMAGPGSVLSSQYQSSSGIQSSNMFGYLADEDYFANCGGGNGSSSSNNSNNINVSQYGDTLYINGQAVVVPGVSQSNLNYHFHNFGSVMDADSNIYRTLIYGNDEWMVENLKTQIGSFTTPASDPNLPIYIQADSIGYYYSTSDLNNACPIGWHVSSVSDWQDLHYEIFGTSMNPTGFTSSANGYDDNNYQILWSQYLNATTPGTNQSAFNLFRTGFWNNSINGVEQEDRASFWTTTGCSSGNNYLINLSENGFTLDVGCTSAGNVKAQVRCVRD